MRGFCLESGKWWRIDFTPYDQSHLRAHVKERDDLSINVFELLAMVVTAWALTVNAGETPDYPGQNEFGVLCVANVVAGGISR